MSELKIKLHTRKEFRLLAAGSPGEESSLVYSTAYTDDDFILLETDGECHYCVIQLDDAMPPALVYVPGTRMTFHIPPVDKRSCYSPKCFSGTCHLLRARAATAEEIAQRRNLAFNPYDTVRETAFFPHASTNIEVPDLTFAPRNAIDGIFENNSHGNWPYQAWGINKDPNATFRLDFGRYVTVDELRLTLRADFPHDSWWTEATIAFSDGSKETLQLKRTGKPQIFSIRPRSIQWLELRELKKAEDKSKFPALTQIEVYGIETDS